MLSQNKCVHLLTKLINMKYHQKKKYREDIYLWAQLTGLKLEYINESITKERDEDKLKILLDVKAELEFEAEIEMDGYRMNNFDEIRGEKNEKL